MYFNLFYRFNTSGCRTYWQEEGMNFVKYSWYCLFTFVAATDTERHSEEMYMFVANIRMLFVIQTALCQTQGDR